MIWVNTFCFPKKRVGTDQSNWPKNVPLTLGSGSGSGKKVITIHNAGGCATGVLVQNFVVWPHQMNL